MSFMDKAKDLAEEHSEEVEQGIDKAAEIIDEKTGGEHSEQITQGAEKAKDFMLEGEGEQPAEEGDQPA